MAIPIHLSLSTSFDLLFGIEFTIYFYFFAKYLRIPFLPDHELEVVGLQRIFPLGDVVAAFF